VLAQVPPVLFDLGGEGRALREVDLECERGKDCLLLGGQETVARFHGAELR
jgi:hypothetical protein